MHILNKQLTDKELCGLNNPCSSFYNFKVSEGWYGDVFKVYICNKWYALKRFKKTMIDDLNNKTIASYDYDILKTLNDSSHYPTLHAYEEQEWMLVDWIDGVPLRETNKDLYLMQMFIAHMDSIDAGWFPDDVKGDNIMVSNGKLIIIDVGSYLPIIPDLDYSVYDKTKFVIDHAHIYPSIRDDSPYDLKLV